MQCYPLPHARLYQFAGKIGVVNFVKLVARTNYKQSQKTKKKKKNSNNKKQKNTLDKHETIKMRKQTSTKGKKQQSKLQSWCRWRSIGERSEGLS